MPKYPDITGQQIGNFFVESIRTARDEKGRKIAICKCVCICGKTKELIRHAVNGKRRTISCGCLRKGHPGYNKTHDMTHTKLYSVWHSMRSRCMYKGNHSYKYYGGRGIKVCEQWQHSFESFRDYIISNFGSLEAGYTIDRLDNNKDYEPGNIKLSTYEEQNSNKSDNRILDLNGEKITLSRFCRKNSLPVSSVSRYLKKGLTPSEIAKTKARRNKKLSEVERQQAIKMYTVDKLSHKKIAKSFAVSSGQIYNIAKPFVVSPTIFRSASQNNTVNL